MWRVALDRLRDYRTRGLLGAAGVAVGAGSIVFLTTLVSSLAAESTEGLNRLGQNRVFVTAAPAKPGAAARPPSLTAEAAAFLRQRVPDITAATPVVSLSATLLACGSREPVRLLAVAPDHAAMERQRLSSGRYITDTDIKRGAGVVVVGYSLWRRNACLSRIGAAVQIGTQSYRIVGLLGPRGTRFGESQDETMHLPFSTAERRYIRPGMPVSLIVTVRPGANVNGTASIIRRLLLQKQRLAEQGVVVSTQTDLLRETDRVKGDVVVLTALVLLVALVIAAIGVMNAVMTSVVERTPEIGLRRAVGATRASIGLQFLGESVVITTLGAVAGIIAGVGAAAIVTSIVRAPLSVEPGLAGLALLASSALGMLCGLWPALRAARLAPVDALRHE